MGRSMTCVATILAVVILGFGEPKRLNAEPLIIDENCSNVDLIDDLIPKDGDVLSGTFSNVDTFCIATGRTVSIAQGVPLSIKANLIAIYGTLDGNGAGHLGGDQVDNTTAFCSQLDNGTESGTPGEGPGGGGGGLFGCAFEGSGGGGGGYGGTGGQSGSNDGNPAPATGGATVGTEDSPPIEMGSGGGSGSPYSTNDGVGGSGAGGHGGAAISLEGPLIILNGEIIANGNPGQSGVQPFPLNLGTSAGGGGSGGGILLDSGPNGTLYLNGEIKAIGGNGGRGVVIDEDGIPGETGSGGGGGGGGRVILLGQAEFGAFSCDVSGGKGGGSGSAFAIQAEAGVEGTCFDGTTSPTPAPIDADGDGVSDADDLCPDTVIPESVFMTTGLGVNRFALVDEDGTFSTTSPPGKGPQRIFTIQDTAGCSCEQIIARLNLGRGHTKFGCSIGALQTWIDSLD